MLSKVQSFCLYFSLTQSTHSYISKRGIKISSSRLKMKRASPCSFNLEDQATKPHLSAGYSNTSMTTYRCGDPEVLSDPFINSSH